MNRKHRRLARRFLRDERGAVVYFGLVILVLMLMIGGISVDVMRTVAEQTRAENTADNAALAAASLRQELPAETVVNSYFDTAGIRTRLGTVTETEGLNFRRVTANTQTEMPTLFMRMSGVDELNMSNVGTAEERITNVEISLVLDISGSMRTKDKSGNSQIDLLRTAAKQFIETMLKGDRRDRFSISIVPYAGSVNPGAKIYSKIGKPTTHTQSHCVELKSAQFTTSTITNPSSFDQVPHFMKWKSAAGMEWGWCPNATTSIKYFSSDVDALKTYIDGMKMHDGTGTHIGMWWGLGLLDPANKWITDTLVADNVVEAKFADRPRAWTDSETLKVVVLMTDGGITDQFRPKDPTLEANATLSIEQQDAARPKGADTFGKTESTRTTNRNWFYSVCNRARTNKVVVYTIAFNTSGDAVTEMRNCATTPSQFYDVKSLEINNAFRSIAGSIRDLRLTQ